MRFVKPLLMCAVIASVQALALQAQAAPTATGAGGGGPAPLLGLTILGQLAGGAGIFAAWRKRKDKDRDPD